MLVSTLDGCGQHEAAGGEIAEEEDDHPADVAVHAFLSVSEY